MSVLGDYNKKAVQALVPVTVHVDLTYRCHQNCLHCYLPRALRLGKGQPELTTSEVKRVLDQLAAAGAFFLTFSGGEVFLRPDLLEILAYARRQNFAVALMTSGLRTADAGLVHSLKDIGVVNIFLTLFSLDAATHDHITQTPGSWAAAWNTLTNCRSQELPIVLNCLVMAPNFTGMRDLVEMVRREKISLRWDYDLWPRWDGQPHLPELILSPEQKEGLDREFYDSEIMAKASENLGLPPDLQGCAAGLNHCYLNPQAELWPCLDVKWPCGKLQGNADFHRLWQDSAVLKKVRFLQKEMCNPGKKLCHIYQSYISQPG